ncbi:MAG: folate-binding protein YgfZ [Actinobacteria bacterium]|nr:folate-binding protein YgfZ [Actinomycetota bacterium]
MADPAPAVELDAQYRAMREEAGLVERPQIAAIAVSGPDAAEFLQGQLTNDVEALETGGGCYAALLDRKGHVQADMRVLRTGSGELLLLTEAEAAPGLVGRLGTYKVGREVEIADRGGELSAVSLLGPRSAQLAGAEGLGPEHAHREVSPGAVPARAVATDLGVDLLLEPGLVSELQRALLAAGAELAGADAAEILRIEMGRPRFGRELGPATMPAEAGIVERAIDFEKGCYIGQEPVARLHYRGRPNRTLRGLRLAGPAEPGAAISSAEKRLGEVGSACISPALGPIALAIVRREAEPGDTVSVAGGGEAEVVELPFRGQPDA